MIKILTFKLLVFVILNHMSISVIREVGFLLKNRNKIPFLLIFYINTQLTKVLFSSVTLSNLMVACRLEVPRGGSASTSS